MLYGEIRFFFLLLLLKCLDYYWFQLNITFIFTSLVGVDTTALKSIWFDKSKQPKMWFGPFGGVMWNIEWKQGHEFIEICTIESIWIILSNYDLLWWKIDWWYLKTQNPWNHKLISALTKPTKYLALKIL